MTAPPSDGPASLIDPEATIDLLADLVQIPSPYFEEAEIADFVYDWLDDRDLDPQFHPVSEPAVTGFEGNNVVARLSGSGGGDEMDDTGADGVETHETEWGGAETDDTDADGDDTGGPCVLLNAHMDTVQIVEGWESDPFAGRVEDGKLYGQGACDMKGGLAASMMAFDAVARSEDVDGEVLFTAVVDEEGPYGLGTDRLLRDGYVDECDMAIVPEPGPLLAQEPVEHPAIMLGARGRVLVEVTVHGEAAHGSRPERGTNAVVAASKIATAVEERLPVGSHPALGAGSVCPLLLEGGSETLSVPETARLLVDRHIVLGETESQVLADFEGLVQSLDLDVDVDIGLRDAPEADMEYGPYVTDRDHPLVTALSDATRSTTGQALDFGYFSSVGDFNYLGHRAGLPTAILGPDGGNIHSAEEFVYTEDVVDVARILADGLYRVLR